MSFELFNDDIILYFLVFCRVGMAMTLLPAFGASYITPRSRLFLAVAVSLIIGSIINGDEKFEVDNSPIGILIAIFSEITIGFFIGALARIIGSAIHIAGMIIATQSAMAQATLFDPSQGGQGAIFGNFLELLAIALLFSLNLHHLLLSAIAGSYEVYPIATMPDLAAFSDAAARTMSKSFAIGFQLAAPIVIVGLLVNLASGVLSRLMPSFQVFFVITPAQIMISFFIFATSLSAVMMWYMRYLEVSFTQFLH
jgi:flagellar biosynthetic protein FliR